VDFPQFPEIIYAKDYFDEGKCNLEWPQESKTHGRFTVGRSLKAYDLRKKGITLRGTAEIIGEDPVNGMKISRWWKMLLTSSPRTERTPHEKMNTRSFTN